LGVVKRRVVDLDLHVAVEDDDWSASGLHVTIFMRRWSPCARAAGNEINAQSGGHFQLVVFDGPLEVDWNIGPLSQARRPSTSNILLQRADVAVMAHRAELN